MLFKPDRRAFLAGGLSAAAFFYGRSGIAQTRALIPATLRLSEEIRAAAKKGKAVVLPAGVFPIDALDLPDNTILIGKPGVTLRLSQPGNLLRCHGARKIHLENIIFEGNGFQNLDSESLLHFTNVINLSLHGCTLRNVKGEGLRLEGCGGKLTDNSLEHIGRTAIFSTNSLGLDIAANKISHCGDNGVLIWTDVIGQRDGSRVRDNLIEDIAAHSGGSGQYGNGIDVFRARDVRIENNRISRCAYSAVRNNSGYDIRVEGNICKDLGEIAMYAEFEFKRAVFRKNKITGCVGGIAMTNFDRAKGTGAGGLCEENEISGIRELPRNRQFQEDGTPNYAFGIEAEGDGVIAGNSVVGSPWVGLQLGWGPALRNVVARSNTLINNAYGIGFTAIPPAGPATIYDNVILGSKKAAIVAMQNLEIISKDLGAAGAVNPYLAVAIGKNRFE